MNIFEKAGSVFLTLGKNSCPSFSSVNKSIYDDHAMCSLKTSTGIIEPKVCIHQYILNHSHNQSFDLAFNVNKRTYPSCSKALSMADGSLQFETSRVRQHVPKNFFCTYLYPIMQQHGTAEYQNGLQSNVLLFLQAQFPYYIFCLEFRNCHTRGGILPLPASVLKST